MISKFNQFNEKLRADVYRSAAEKLSKLGHKSRADKINNHINKSLSDHVFNIWIFGTHWTRENQTTTYKNVLKTPIQGKLISIIHDNSLFEDLKGDGGVSSPLYISPEFEITSPFTNTKEFSQMADCGFLRKNNIQIFDINPFLGNDKRFSTDGKISLENINGEFIGKFSDRKSAVEFKKALKNVLFNKILHYGHDTDEHTDELLTISDAIRDGLLKWFEDSTLNDVHSLYYSICNLNTNSLYTEDGIW
jgi:hypothetical protein